MIYPQIIWTLRVTKLIFIIPYYSFSTIETKGRLRGQDTLFFFSFISQYNNSNKIIYQSFLDLKKYKYKLIYYK